MPRSEVLLGPFGPFGPFVPGTWVGSVTSDPESAVLPVSLLGPSIL